jgi:hypothetical protein
VVFYSHFDRGFGLPASLFFRSFLEFFQLHPHHLGANAVMILSAFVTLCEGYIGVWLTTDIWAKFFHFKAQKAKAKHEALMECGAASIYTRPRIGFPKVGLPESSKRWQDTFLYAKNVNPDHDVINLPQFVNMVPAKVNWKYTPSTDDAKANGVAAQVRILCDLHGLKGSDLVATFVERRVQPLRNRAHKIGLMSGTRDPTHFSTKTLSKAQITKRVSGISRFGLKHNWEYGMRAFSRSHRAPAVSSLLCRQLPAACCRPAGALPWF